MSCFLVLCSITDQCVMLDPIFEGVNGVHLKSVISKILAKKSVISKNIRAKIGNQ